jgi:hypothetical protein
LRADKAETEFGAVAIVRVDENNVVAGLEVLLASVRCRQAHVDTFVDATENTVSDYVFHVLHNTPIGSAVQTLDYRLK